MFNFFFNCIHDPPFCMQQNILPSPFPPHPLVSFENFNAHTRKNLSNFCLLFEWARTVFLPGVRSRKWGRRPFKNGRQCLDSLYESTCIYLHW